MITKMSKMSVNNVNVTQSHTTQHITRTPTYGENRWL